MGKSIGAGFERLLEPGRIGSVRTRNRLIKSAAGLQYWATSGNPVTEKVKCLYEAFSKGGVGLIIMESPSIEKGGRSYRLDDERQIRQVAELTEVIHRHGCPVFAQLADLANWNLTGLPENDTRAPSKVCVLSEMDNHNHMPRELRTEEIEELIEKFAVNSVGAEKAGFDGVEINTSCTHLLHTFLSPFWNRRQDRHGCKSLEDRTRLLVGIIREIKKRLGSDFPVSVIMNGLETGKLIGVEDDECLGLQDSVRIARIVQDAGADAVQVRSHWIGRHDASFLTDHLLYPEPPIPIADFPKELDMSRGGAGANAKLAQAVKEAVSVPVITVGRLDPGLGEQLLREGKADFIALTRRLFADPELPNKIAAGRAEDIAPCTSCTCCKAEGSPRRCRINGAIGTDRPYEVEPSENRKKVVVAGGGPAGLEAARVAALRGHDVTLFEKSSRLGGLLPLAAMVKGLEIEDLPAITRYLKTQIDKLGVKTRLRTELTPELVQEIRPDVVVVATGGIPALPELPGMDRPNVVKNTDLHRELKFFLNFLGPKNLRRLTRLWMPIGRRVAIIGGGIHGCELAEFLVKRGRKVTIVDSADSLGEDVIEHLKLQLFWWFREKGVVMMPAVEPLEITEKGLTVLTRQGYRRTVEADSIVPALPMKPNTALLERLRGRVPELYAVGDCAKPRLIADAISSARMVSISL